MALQGFRLASRDYQQITPNAPQASIPVPNLPGAETSAVSAQLTDATSQRIRASLAQNMQTAAAGYNSLANAAQYSGASVVRQGENIGSSLASLGMGIAEAFMKINEQKQKALLEQYKIDYVQEAQSLASDASASITGEGGTMEYRNAMQALVNKYQGLGLNSESLASGLSLMFEQQRQAQRTIDDATLKMNIKLAETDRERAKAERHGKYSHLIGGLSAGVNANVQQEAATAIYSMLSQDAAELDNLTFNELSTSVLNMLNDELYKNSAQAQTIARNVYALQQAHNADARAYYDYQLSGSSQDYYASQSAIIATLPAEVREIFKQNTAMQAAAADVSQAMQNLNLQQLNRSLTNEQLTQLDMSRADLEGQTMGALIQYFYDNPGKLAGIKQAYGGQLPPGFSEVEEATVQYTAFMTGDRTKLLNEIDEVRFAIAQLQQVQTVDDYNFLAKLKAGELGFISSNILRDAVPQMLAGIDLPEGVVTPVQSQQYLEQFRRGTTQLMQQLTQNRLPIAIEALNSQQRRWESYGLFTRAEGGALVPARIDTTQALSTINSFHERLNKLKQTQQNNNFGVPPNFRMPQLYSERTAEGAERIYPFLPTAKPVITSAFGATESFRSSPHRGVDFGVDVGTPIVAVAPGEIIFAQPNVGDAGTMVVYRSDDGYEHEFLHLDSFNVAVGQRVMPGDIIARSGNTGRSRGPHLDWRIKDPGGSWIDPLPYSERIPQKLRQIRGADTPNVVSGVIPTSSPGRIPAGGYVGQAERVQSDTAGAQAILQAAQRLQLDPVELTALMSFESAGTLNPNVMGGDGGKYKGLIQFDPWNQQHYGTSKQQSIAQQVPAIVQYLLDNGFKPGQHDIRHAYSAILAGEADESYWGSSDSNGTTVHNAYNLFRSGEHYERARQFLNDSQASLVMSSSNAMANVASGGVPPGLHSLDNPVRMSFASNDKSAYKADPAKNFGYAALTNGEVRGALYRVSAATDVPAQWLADSIALFGSWRPDGVNSTVGGLGLSPFTESNLPVPRAEWMHMSAQQQLNYVSDYIERAKVSVGSIDTPTELVVLFSKGLPALVEYKKTNSFLGQDTLELLLRLGIHAGRQYRTPATARRLVTHSRFTSGCSVCENMRAGGFFTPHEGFL